MKTSLQEDLRPRRELVGNPAIRKARKTGDITDWDQGGLDATRE